MILSFEPGVEFTFLGITIERLPQGLLLHRKTYAELFLEEHEGSTPNRQRWTTGEPEHFHKVYLSTKRLALRCSWKTMKVPHLTGNAGQQVSQNTSKRKRQRCLIHRIQSIWRGSKADRRSLALSSGYPPALDRLGVSWCLWFRSSSSRTYPPLNLDFVTSCNTHTLEPLKPEVLRISILKAAQARPILLNALLIQILLLLHLDVSPKQNSRST